jgi:multiple sugar transport system substrate-binding protein
MMPMQTSPASMIAAGIVPDLFTLWFGDTDVLAELKALENLEPLMKSHNFDPNSIDKETWDSLSALTSQNVKNVVPFYYNMNALLYNKDIFDKFAVPYPKDGMTWEEVRDLGVKVNRMDGGEQYYGFYPDAIQRLSMQMNLPFVDKSTGKAALTTDKWKGAFELWRSIHESQNMPVANQDFAKGKLAMVAAHINIIRGAMKNTALNWDIVTYPQHKDYPGISQRPDGAMISITPTSKHKNEAFLVLQTMLSPEVQQMMTRQGNLTVLKDNAIKKQFGADVPGFAGKHIEAILAPKFGIATNVPRFTDQSGYKVINAGFKAMMDEGMDTNTGLRKTNEALDAMLEELKRR